MKSIENNDLDEKYIKIEKEKYQKFKKHIALYLLKLREVDLY